MSSNYQSQPSKRRFFKRSKPALSAEEHVGKKAEVKTFYDIGSSETGQTWAEWAPLTVPDTKKIKWEGYAIHVFKEQDSEAELQSNASFKIRHILLLSPYIRDELKDVLEPYGVIFEANHAKIDWPLAPLFFAREKIAEVSKTAELDQAREHLSLLCVLIDKELGTIIDEVEQLEIERKITFKLLWTLFPKGDIILQPTETFGLWGHRLVKTSYEENGFRVQYEWVGFDGQIFGYRWDRVYIDHFKGKEDVEKLPVYPLSTVNNFESVKESIMERGRRMMNMQDVHHLQYQTLRKSDSTGIGQIWDPETPARIVVDNYTFEKRNPDDRERFYAPLPGYKLQEKELQDTSGPGPQSGLTIDKPGCRPTKEAQQKNIDVILMNKDHLLMLEPIVNGFSLTSKTWTQFAVERVAPLRTTADAYNHLVYSQNSKDLVSSMVEQRSKRLGMVKDDVIAGKGQGLLILLSGPPGTGKTLMVEAVAEKLNLPLYYIDAHDLGTSTSDMDNRLKGIMEDAAEWNALLLLDEADIYLQERSAVSISHNETVSIFLRRIEYYTGTMFLTTNLIDTIDRAVESRIHIHLQFPDLPHASRAKVWNNFLERLPAENCTITPLEIEKLGFWNLNGRQIKSALKIAGGWCVQNGKPLDFDTIEEIITITCPRARRSTEKGQAKNGDEVITNGVSDRHHETDLKDLLL